MREYDFTLKVGETYDYVNKHGWEIATLINTGKNWEVVNIGVGTISEFSHYFDADMFARALLEYWAEYSPIHTVEDAPDTVRNGFVTAGRFAGLPVTYRDGVAGVWLFERFTPLA